MSLAVSGITEGVTKVNKRMWSLYPVQTAEAVERSEIPRVQLKEANIGDRTG